MPMIVLLLVMVIGGALFFWLPRYQVRRALAHPFPRNYTRILHRNVPVFSRLPADLQLQLKRLILQFLLQKNLSAVTACRSLTRSGSRLQARLACCY